MAKKENNIKMVTVNFDKLYEVFKTRRIKLSEVSLRIGHSDNYLSQRKSKYNNTIPEVMLKLICDLYGLDEDEFIVSPQINNCDKTMGGIEISEEWATKLFSKLDKIIELLEVRERQNIMLTVQEDIVLLLQQMLRHGSCIEEQFKQKAKQSGYSAELCTYAIDFLECKRDVVNGKVWLKKK